MEKLNDLFSSNAFNSDDVSRIESNLKNAPLRSYTPGGVCWFVCYLKANSIKPVSLAAFCRYVEKEYQIPFNKTYCSIYQSMKRKKDIPVLDLVSNPAYNLDHLINELKKKGA